MCYVQTGRKPLTLLQTRRPTLGLTRACGTALFEGGDDVMAWVEQLNRLVRVENFLDDLLLYDRTSGRMVGWVTQVPQEDSRFIIPGDLVWIL